MPPPWRTSRKPWTSSESVAWRSETRLTFRAAASARSEGRRSPGLQPVLLHVGAQQQLELLVQAPAFGSAQAAGVGLLARRGSAATR